MSARENRPDPKIETAPEMRLAAHTKNTGSVTVPHLSAAEIEASLPMYVLVSKNPHDRITRRVYLSLHAAVNASKRAEMRGQAVSLELCRVVPYLTGRELHGIGGDDA